jgi:hypothetical protein
MTDFIDFFAETARRTFTKDGEEMIPSENSTLKMAHELMLLKKVLPQQVTLLHRMEPSPLQKGQKPKLRHRLSRKRKRTTPRHWTSTLPTWLLSELRLEQRRRLDLLMLPTWTLLDRDFRSKTLKITTRRRRYVSLFCRGSDGS